MAGVDDSGCGWMAACERSRSCLARASWPKAKGSDGVVVGSLAIKDRRVDTLGYALQTSLDGRSGVVIPAMLSLDNLDRISQPPTPEVALSLACEPSLGAHVMLPSLLYRIDFYYSLYCPRWIGFPKCDDIM